MSAYRFSLLAAVALAVPATLLACSAATPDDGAASEGAASGANVGPSTFPRFPEPAGPGVKATPVHMEKAKVLAAWKKIRDAFYVHADGSLSTDGYEAHSFTKRDGTTGTIAKPTVTPNQTGAAVTGYEEAAYCMTNCPTNYSDIVCHFYCWTPTYSRTIYPNVRGCFSSLARGGGIPATVDANGSPTSYKPGAIIYPEIYDYCTFQPYDAVSQGQGQPTPAWDPTMIAANKASGTRVGVNSWIDKNVAEVFKYLMFTWFDEDTFDKDDQTAVIKEFYGTRPIPPRAQIPSNLSPGYEQVKAAMHAYWVANP